MITREHCRQATVTASQARLSQCIMRLAASAMRFTQLRAFFSPSSSSFPPSFSLVELSSLEPPVTVWSLRSIEASLLSALC